MKIKKAVSNGLFLLLYLSDYPDPWVWPDNSTADYLNWGNLHPGYYDCVMADYGTGEWKDVSCTQNSTVICQLPAELADDTHEGGDTEG